MSNKHVRISLKPFLDNFETICKTEAGRVETKDLAEELAAMYAEYTCIYDYTEDMFERGNMPVMAMPAVLDMLSANMAMFMAALTVLARERMKQGEAPDLSMVKIPVVEIEAFDVTSFSQDDVEEVEETTKVAPEDLN